MRVPSCEPVHSPAHPRLLQLQDTPSNFGGDMKFSFVVLMTAVLAFAGCSGGGGTTNELTTEKTTVVVGKFDAPKAAGDPITVQVLSDPSITTTVGTDGTFTLRG